MKKVIKLLFIIMLLFCLIGCNKKEKNEIVNEIITNDEVIESTTNDPVVQENVNTNNIFIIDLKPEWLKYRDITLNREYLSNRDNELYMIDDSIGYDGKEAFYESNNIGTDQIDGIEIYGIYFDDIEINEEITSESTVLYNFPTAIDGKDVISIVLHYAELNNRTIDGKKVSMAEVNVPENVILISGIVANLIHINDKCKYISNCFVIDRFSDNMVIFNSAKFFIEKNELLLNNNIVLAEDSGISIDGHIEKVIVDGVICSPLPFGNSLAIGKNDVIQNALKDYNDWYLGDIYINSSVPGIRCSGNSVHLGDNIEIHGLNFANDQSNSDMLFEIGKNVMLGDDGFLRGMGIKKLIIGTSNITGQITVDKDCQIINKSGEEIQWRNIIFYNSNNIKDQTFKSGRLDMGDFAIDVTEE